LSLQKKQFRRLIAPVGPPGRFRVCVLSLGATSRS
jgi:hypothetical protein